MLFLTTGPFTYIVGNNWVNIVHTNDVNYELNEGV